MGLGLGNTEIMDLGKTGLKNVVKPVYFRVIYIYTYISNKVFPMSLNKYQRSSRQQTGIRHGKQNSNNEMNRPYF